MVRSKDNKGDCPGDEELLFNGLDFAKNTLKSFSKDITQHRKSDCPNSGGNGVKKQKFTRLYVGQANGYGTDGANSVYEAKCKDELFGVVIDRRHHFHENWPPGDAGHQGVQRVPPTKIKPQLIP